MIVFVLIFGNWFGFIYLVVNGYVVEVLFGYYIFLLVVVMLGVLVLGECLGWLYLIVVVFVVVVVVILGIGLGVVLWIVFWLVGMFSFYGLIKK